MTHCTFFHVNVVEHLRNKLAPMISYKQLSLFYTSKNLYPFSSCYYTKRLSISCPCAAVSLHYLQVYDMPFRGDAHISHVCLREEQQPAASDMVLLEDISIALHLTIYPTCNKTSTNTHVQQEIVLILHVPLPL